MSAIRITLFGKFQAVCNDRVLDGLNGCKVQELFSYLLLYRTRPHPRETLASMLWGNRLTAQSKKYLRQSLWQLQTILDAQMGARRNRILLVETDWVRINSDADLWIDVAAFEQALALVEGARAEEIDDSVAQTLVSAAHLYRGDLLEGTYQDWCLYERERLQNLYLSMLDKLMAYYEVRCEYEKGIIFGERILSYDRARERTHRSLMRLRYLAGDRTGALRQYENCAAALAEELGVKAARSTQLLFEQIRADNLEAPSASSGAAAALLPETLARLERLRVLLNEIQDQIQHEIQSVKRALNGQP
jgi:DNA-binding SARP family transcriptional activator